MASDQRKQELFKQIHDAIVDFDEDNIVGLCQTALDEGIDAYETITGGLAAGMETVGELYDKKEYFVPEVLMCADTFYAGLEILRPKVVVDSSTVRGQVVLGTVEGDVHDIGKNLVKLMLDAAGFTVHDLGKDVKLDRFVEVQQETGAEIVALSALMTTSMLAIPVVIEKLRAVDPNVKVIIGGAPISQESVELYGADGYADNAVNAVQEAVRLMQEFGN